MSEVELQRCLEAILMVVDEPVYSVNFSPDGKTLVSGSEDKTIKLWNGSTGEEIYIDIKYRKIVVFNEKNFSSFFCFPCINF